MPRYNHRLATKKYVQRQIHKPEWSDVYRVSLDFQNETVDDYIYELYSPIVDLINNNSLWEKIQQSTDAEAYYETHIKICYIRVYLRYALGESEVFAASSQTIRTVVYRVDQPYQVVYTNPGNYGAIKDVDAMPRYIRFFGEINGLLLDTSGYVHSGALTGTSLYGGQIFCHHLIINKMTDTIYKESESGPELSEKGCLCIQIVSDNPSGENASAYGYVEIGFKVRESN